MNEKDVTMKELPVVLHPANTRKRYELTRCSAYLIEETLNFSGEVRFIEEEMHCCSLRIVADLCSRENNVLGRIRAEVEGVTDGDSIVGFSDKKDMCGRSLFRLDDYVLEHLSYLEICVYVEANCF